MMFLFHAHSGLRYLVILVGLIALLAFAYSMITGKPIRAARGLTAAYTGVLDLQALLGIILIFTWPFYGALMGHVTMMVVAVAVAHVASVRARRTSDERRALAFRLGGVALSLLLIVLGILAIGRSVV